MELWRHTLGLIAVVTGGALAVMNVLGSFGAFADPLIAYGAAGIALIADVGIVALLFGFQDFKQKGRRVALTIAIPFWIVFSAYSVIHGGKWLEHALETAQKPVRQQRLTETQKQDDLKAERGRLDKANEIALNGKTPAIRDNARKEAADARGHIADLENTNTFQAAAVTEPIKSPLTGYERLTAFILWAASQACWFMAYGQAATGARSAAQNRRGTRSGNRGAASPAPLGHPLKSKENLSRPISGQEAGQSGVIIPMRRRAKPRSSEISALQQSGMSQRKIGEALGVSARTIRRILDDAKNGAHAAHMA
jgi:hypothetical protein